MNYFKALYEFSLEFKPLTKINYTKSNLVFLGASMILGFIVISVDILAYYLKDKSFLDMKYNSHTKYWLVIPAWAFAATIVSYLGLIMGIFNSTIQSCVIVGFSWLYLAAKITNKIAEPETTQE